jgi:hypothetical protein
MQLEGDLERARQQVTELTGSRDSAPRASSNGSIQSGTAGGVKVSLPTGVLWAPGLYTAAAAPGLTNLVRIEGTSTVHNWQVEGHLIGGNADLTEGTLNGTNLNAKVSVFIPVRSLKSVQSNGQPYSDAMDEIMYGKLRGDEFKRITYTLSSLRVKEQPGATTASLHWEAVGSLGVAGVTNTVTMPIAISPAADGKIQFTGEIGVKMTDFNIKPPAPSFGGLSINTGDAVTLKFSWWVKPSTRLEAAK